MNFKKIGAFGLFAFALVFATSFVLAATDGGVFGQISGPSWFTDIVYFFGWGETWSAVIISLAVLMIVLAATYDILEFTAFESKWVKFLIAIGVAAIVSVTRGLAFISGILLSIAGGSVAFATAAAIVLAVGFFIVGTFFKGKMRKLKYKEKGEEMEGIYEMLGKADAGQIKRAKAALEAGK